MSLQSPKNPEAFVFRTVSAAHSKRLRRFSLDRRGLGVLVLAVGLGLGYLGGGGLERLRPIRKDVSDLRYFPRNIGQFPNREEIEKIFSRNQAALESNPADLTALMASGMAYYALGREHAVEAINRFETARDYGATDARLFYYLGHLYDLVGLRQFAIPEYERFLRHRPMDRQALLELAKIYFDLGNYASSAGLYERLGHTDGGKKRDPLVMENLALALLKLQDWEKARALLDDLRRDQRHYSKEMSFFMAEAFRGLGRCPEAFSFYDEALEMVLDAPKELAVLEAKLACLTIVPASDEAVIRGVAEKILKLDAKNSTARSALRKFKKSSRKGPLRD